MRLPALILAAASAVALAACGSSDEPSSSASTAASAAAGPFPVSIAHQFGTTTVPKAPERVVTVGFNEQDYALALGVKPVGVREFLGAFPYKTRPWAPGANSDPTPILVGGDEIDYEKVAQARPDLILGIYSFIDRTGYSKLSRLAPTIAQTKDFAAGAVPWDRQLIDTGKALGREAKARQVVQEVNAEFAQAVKDHPDFKGKSLAVAFDGGGSTFVLGGADLRQQFFTGLGFETPKDVEKESQEDNLSRERLDVLDQDVLVLISSDDKGLTQDPLYKRLKAVREGRVINVKATDAFAGALGFNSPLSRPYLLKQVVPQLVAALDGDPATKVPAAE
jgi:iron complex transport system substrate-binding protein